MVGYSTHVYCQLSNFYAFTKPQPNLCSVLTVTRAPTVRRKGSDSGVASTPYSYTYTYCTTPLHPSPPPSRRSSSVGTRLTLEGPQAFNNTTT